MDNEFLFIEKPIEKIKIEHDKTILKLPNPPINRYLNQLQTECFELLENNSGLQTDLTSQDFYVLKQYHNPDFDKEVQRIITNAVKLNVQDFIQNPHLYFTNNLIDKALDDNHPENRQNHEFFNNFYLFCLNSKYHVMDEDAPLTSIEQSFDYLSKEIIDVFFKQSIDEKVLIDEILSNIKMEDELPLFNGNYLNRYGICSYLMNKYENNLINQLNDRLVDFCQKENIDLFPTYVVENDKHQISNLNYSIIRQPNYGLDIHLIEDEINQISNLSVNKAHSVIMGRACVDWQNQENTSRKCVEYFYLENLLNDFVFSGVEHIANNVPNIIAQGLSTPEMIYEDDTEFANLLSEFKSVLNNDEKFIEFMEKETRHCLNAKYIDLSKFSNNVQIHARLNHDGLSSIMYEDKSIYNMSDLQECVISYIYENGNFIEHLIDIMENKINEYKNDNKNVLR